MMINLPKEVQEGLDAARKIALKRSSRLRVETGDKSYPLMRLWDRGFSVDPLDVPPLRGFVDIYDGARHIFQCLIVASEEEEGGICYEFKRSTPTLEAAPLDFYREDGSPAALIGPPDAAA